MDTDISDNVMVRNRTSNQGRFQCVFHGSVGTLVPEFIEVYLIVEHFELADHQDIIEANNVRHSRKRFWTQRFQ